MLNVDQNIEKFKSCLHLPQQFCELTLREGTVVIIGCTQLITFLFIATVGGLMVLCPKATDEWWRQKFKDDFDPYIMKEEEKLIEKLHSYWKPVAYALLSVEGLYFFVGFGVIYALYKRNVHPAFYLPWLTMTAFLVACNFLTVLAMIVVTFIHATYREITVTWDMVPTMLVFIYACMWFYGFLVCLSHYKRRVIVHWWRKHGVDLSK